MVKAAVDTFGRLDTAFNNAGIRVPPSDAADEPAGSSTRVNAINLRGVWACMKSEWGEMRVQGIGAPSTAPPLAVSSDFRAGLPITPPSTECSG